MTAATPRRRRRWLWLLLVLGLLGIAAWWIDRQLEPQRLTALVLKQAGAALALELRIDGEPGYTLRPEPSLHLPRLTVTLPGESAPLLSAALLQVSLPWQTLLDGGTPLRITRLELDAPALDLRLLRRWQAAQPESPFELPTLSEGLRIRDGRVLDETWSLQQWSLDLPRLAPEEPARLTSRGTLQLEADRIDFDGQWLLATAGLASAMTFNVSGIWQRGEQALPYRLGFDGDFSAGDAVLRVTAAQLELDSESPLPDFTGSGRLQSDTQWAIELTGALADWPADWPALPAPIGQSTAPLQITGSYVGPDDLSGESVLALRREDAAVDARFRWQELQAWLDGPKAGLPPLQFSADAKRVEIDGAVLEGVRVKLSGPDSGDATE